MFKNVNVAKIFLVLLILFILVANIIKYNNGKDLSKLLEDFISNENYTEYSISFTISDNEDYKSYSLDDKELIVEVLNYFKDLRPIKIYKNIYEDEGKELNKRYSIYITANYYITQKKENYTLKEQKADTISIYIDDSNSISVICSLDTDYKENFSHDYKINQNFDESFIYNMIKKYNLKDSSQD
ncbi:MAG TPA: hypothetical protein DC000_09825 [Clostridiales bacterium]|nr:hypothetical protein [Clostridiales bacterium]